MDRDFEIGGRSFKLHKIDAMKQFHVVRRVGPILAELVPAMKGAASKGAVTIDKMSEDEKLEAIAKFIGPIMNGLSKLNDADAELVLRNLLSAVEIKQTTGNWARVATPEVILMGDLEFPILMQVAGRAFMYNLSGFFAALPS